MRLVWTERSRRHLAALFEHIAADNPAAARRVVDRIVTLAERLLREHPRGGRPGRVEGTRDLVVTKTPYIIAYLVEDDRIVVLAVLHGKRRWPRAF